MVIHGLGKTRMFGTSMQVAEDFINIAECVRQGFTQRYDKQTADELIVSAIRLVILADTERREEAEREFGEMMMRIAEV